MSDLIGASLGRYYILEQLGFHRPDMSPRKSDQSKLVSTQSFLSIMARVRHVRSSTGGQNV